MFIINVNGQYVRTPGADGSCAYTIDKAKAHEFTAAEAKVQTLSIARLSQGRAVIKLETK